GVDWERAECLRPPRRDRRAQCACPRRERAGTRAAERHLAARRDEPKCGAQERRLPRPVRAEQSNDLAAAYFKRNVLEHLNSTEVRADSAQGKQRAHESPPRDARRAAMSANTGPPMSAAATPSLSSVSVGNTRTMISAQTRSAPPASALGKSKRAGSCPARARTKCGAAMPTNPITPA